MNVYTYSEARQRFASVLETARKKGKVLVRRKDGTTFAIIPEKKARSPLDVEGINTTVRTDDIVRAIRESRRG